MYSVIAKHILNSAFDYGHHFLYHIYSNANLGGFPLGGNKILIWWHDLYWILIVGGSHPLLNLLWKTNQIFKILLKSLKFKYVKKIDVRGQRIMTTKINGLKQHNNLSKLKANPQQIRENKRQET